MSDTSREAFEQAFTAVRYLLGRRDALLEGLGNATAAARSRAEHLSSPDQTERARHLAAALEPVILALDARRLA